MPDRRIVAFTLILSFSLLGAWFVSGNILRAPAASSAQIIAASDDPGAGQTPPEGAAIFAKNCAKCHGPDGGGTQVAPTLRVDSDPSVVRMTVENGRGAMPAFDGSISGADLGALVGFVVSKSTISLAGGDTGTGGTIYRLNCSGCHGTTGRGGALVGASANPPELTSFPPTVIATAVLFGPGPMPSFSFTQDELASLVQYAETLNRQEHPGGFPLGYRGPVTEALAGAAMLVLLVLGTMWISGRAKG